MASTFPLESGGRVTYTNTNLSKMVYEEEVIKRVIVVIIKIPILSNMHPSMVVSVIAPKD